MRLLAVFALFAIAATTPARMRQEPPADIFTTRLAPAEAAKCLAEGLTAIGQPSVYLTDGGATVSFMLQGMTMLLIDVSRDGQVALWRASRHVAYRKEAMRCLQIKE